MAKIENARDRSLWRINLDGLVVQPALRPSAPQRRTLQLSLPFLPLAAPVSSHRLSSAALPPARPWANPPARIGVFSLGSTGGKHPILTVCYALPIDWRLTFQLALASLPQLGLRSLPIHIWRRPSARLVSQLPVLTGCRCNGQLAPTAAATPNSRWRLPPFATPAANLRLASAVPRRLCRFQLARLAPFASTSGWAFDAPLASIEPCIAD